VNGNAFHCDNLEPGSHDLAADGYALAFENPVAVAPYSTTWVGSVTVLRASATMEFVNLVQVYDGSPKPVGVAATPPGVDAITVTYGGSPDAPTNAGSYAVTASCASANYAASDVSATLVIERAAQSLDVTMHAPAGAAIDGSFTVAATASSGLPVTITTSGACTGEGTDSATIVMSGVSGACSVAYAQGGDENHLPAPTLVEQTVHEEICDGLDNNGDGAADEGLPTAVHYLDIDGDAHGDPSTARLSCGLPGEVTNGLDNCPAAANADQADTDGDGRGDGCDCTWSADPGDEGRMLACASRSDVLASCLADAAADGYDNTIRVVRGLYRGLFTFAQTEGKTLALAGGYSAECTSQLRDPGLTVLDADVDEDGQGDGRVLSLDAGGSVSVQLSSLMLRNGNSGTGDGGCLLVSNAGTTVLDGCEIADCTAQGDGGGAMLAVGDGTAQVGNTIVRGSSAAKGGGVAVVGASGASVTLVNATISRNSASNLGGGLWLEGIAAIDAANTILWGNDAETAGGDLSVAADMADSAVTIRSNDLGVIDVPAAWASPDATNKSADPKFVSPGNLHLTAASPCRDAGDGTSVGPGSWDVDGNPRTLGAAVDIGADEYAQPDALTLTASQSSPQKVGAAVTFTAEAAGGSGRYEYRFWIRPPGAASYTAVGDTSTGYSADADWTWNTSGIAIRGTYTVMVYARNAGSTANRELYRAVTFAVVSETPVAGLTLAPEVNSPQVAGAAVKFTAQATGGEEPYDYEYRFFLRAPGSTAYTAVGDTATGYSTDADWTWHTGGLATHGVYTVMVYARNEGSTANYEKVRAISFTVLAEPPASAVTLAPDPASPQQFGASVKFTAQAAGGEEPYDYEYRFYLRAPGSTTYVPVGDDGVDYSTDRDWTWNTGGIDTYGIYTVMVYARNAGSQANREAYRTVSYAIVEEPPVDGLTLASDVTSPRPAGAKVKFTAQATGGAAPYDYEYRFYLRAPGSTTYTPVGDDATGYSSDTDWTWDTTSSMAGTYTVMVYARNAGSLANYEKYRARTFKVE
jgi:hypothetical protein